MPARDPGRPPEARSGSTDVDRGPVPAQDARDILADAQQRGVVGVLVADARGTVLAVNATFAARSGGTPEQVVGCPVWRWASVISESDWPARWSALLDAGLLEFDCHARAPDGSERPVRVLAELQRPPGSPPRAVFRISPRVRRCAGEVGLFDWNRCVAAYGEEGYWAWNVTTGRISVSREWCTLLGLTPRTQVMPESLRNILGEALFTRLIDESSRMLRGELDRSDALVEVRRMDGRMMWVRHRAYVASRTVDGRAERIVGRAVDVTDECAAADDLRELIERVPVAVMVYRPDGDVHLWNPAVGELLGCASDEVPEEVERRRREGWGLVDERGASVPLDALPSSLALRTGQPIRDRLYGLTPRGSQVRRWGVLSALPRCGADGRLLDVVTTFTDITHHRQLESALARASRLESLGRLAGGVAHDFNNLLTSILGNAELIRMALPERPGVLEEIDEIVEAGRRGAALTRQLLAYARRQPMRARPLLLGRWVRSAGAVLDRLMGAPIALILPEADGPSVRADPHQLEQVLVDLTLNARAAMDGRGTLRFAVDSLVLEPGHGWPEANPGRYGRLRIIDDGPGMAPEVSARVFEPFFTTKNVSGGAGLGLATCYGIVRQNDGHIRLHSAPGHGTTVELLLPRCAGPDRDLPLEVAEASAQRDGAQGAVLVVDGDPAVRRMASRVLAANGYTVWTAADRAEVMQLVERGQRPDLVVVDVALPRSSGTELVACLRERWPDLGALFTAREEGAEPGSGDWLRKPYGPSTLARRVEEGLSAIDSP